METGYNWMVLVELVSNWKALGRFRSTDTGGVFCQKGYWEFSGYESTASSARLS